MDDIRGPFAGQPSPGALRTPFDALSDPPAAFQLRSDAEKEEQSCVRETMTLAQQYVALHQISPTSFCRFCNASWAAFDSPRRRAASSPADAMFASSARLSLLAASSSVCRLPTLFVPHSICRNGVRQCKLVRGSLAHSAKIIHSPSAVLRSTPIPMSQPRSGATLASSAIRGLPA